MKKEEKLKSLVELFKATGDESRLEILCKIFEKKDLCVSDLAKELGFSVAITSHHLKAMEATGLLSSSRSGKKICYKLSSKPIVSDLKKIICKYK
jgi:DNA-binding transcriptional ArsR family regulator